MIEGPNERYQIATSAFRCILSGSRKEAAYKTYSAGVKEIRTAGSSCRRPQLLLDQIYIFFLHSIGPSGVDSIGEEAANSTRNTIYSLKVFFRPACVSIETHNLQRVFRSGG